MKLFTLFFLVFLMMPRAFAYSATELLADELHEYAFAANNELQAIKDVSSDLDLVKWFGLLKYKKLSDGFESEITSTDYFFHNEGRTRPIKELNASISALLEDVKSSRQCEFPARFLFLVDEFNKDKTQYNLSHCTELNEWARLDTLQSASLIYASGYLGNPASFFGHLMIKLNYGSGRAGANMLLDKSFNFGAAIPPQDGALTYVFKGFFGGYYATYRDDTFFRHHKVYAESEARDLWDYQLNLDKKQLKLLILHLWELRGKRFDYYYLNDNCASRIAELIEFITGEKLLEPNTPWAQPINVFKAIAKPEKSLITQLTKHQSNYNRFRTQYQGLNSEEQTLLALLYQNFDKNLITLRSRTPDAQSNVLDVLLDYLNYTKAVNNENTDLRKKVLKLRMKLPIATKSTYSTASISPHLGQQPSLTQLSITNRDNEAGVLLRMRATYYDLLSSDIGRLKNSALQMGDLEIYASESGVRLEKFDLTNIMTLRPAETSLEADKALAWKIRVGLENNETRCFECLDATTEVGLGRSYFLPSGVIYGMGELKLQSTPSHLNRISFGLRAGYLFDVSDNWRSYIELYQPAFGLREIDWQDMTTISWQNRFGEGIDADLRVKFETSARQTKLTLSYSHYWQ